MGFIYDRIKQVKGKVVHKTMSEKEFVNLLEENGFSVEYVYHYGYLPKPGRYFSGFAQRMVTPFEKICKAVRVPEKLTQNFCVLAIARS